MSYTIRKATEKDNEFIARAILMGNNPDRDQFSEFDMLGYTALVERTDGPYSFVNTVIACDEETGTPVGALISMPAADYHKRGTALDLDQDIIHWYTEDQYYLDTVAVEPLLRGKGVGTMLINHACEMGKKLGFTEIALSEEMGNDKAYDLYKKLGFVDTVKRANQEGKQFQLMAKKL